MMDILMSETYWAHKKWNEIASDIKLVFYSSSEAHRSFVHLFFNKIQKQIFPEHDTMYVTDTTSFNRPRNFPFLCCLLFIATTVQDSHHSFQWSVYIAMSLQRAFRNKMLGSVTFHSIVKIELFFTKVIWLAKFTLWSAVSVSSESNSRGLNLVAVFILLSPRCTAIALCIFSLFLFHRFKEGNKQKHSGVPSSTVFLILKHMRGH